MRANAAAPERSTLVTAGTFDTGSQSGDLGAAATLQVGGLTVSVPGLTPVDGGRQFRFEQEGLRFVVIPSATQSSKAHFKMALQRDLTGLVDPDAPLTLRFTDPLVDGRGVVTLGGGHFVLGRKPGTLIVPRLYVFRVRAVLAGSGKDRVTVRVGFATDGSLPAGAPDLTLTFGDTFQVTVPGSAFDRRGKRFSGRAADGHTRVVLDYQRETLVLTAKRVDLGSFVEGSQPVRVGVTLGPDIRTDDVRMVLTGRALRY